VNHKSVPWWTEELTLMRKSINALRRRFLRTINNNDLTERSKTQYHDGNLQYQAAITREKFKSWKEYCNHTSATNPWNAVYKLASNKVKRNQTLSILQKPDVLLTTDLKETITYILDYLIPKDEVNNDTDYHNNIRKQTQRPIQKADDREYSPEEIRTAIEAIHSIKAPGEDGITSEIQQRAYRQFPKLINNYITSV